MNVSNERACNFCGKRAAEVEKLLAGGGQQPRGNLPVVFICNECVALCSEIIGATATEAGAAPSWNRITYRSEDFEWLAIPTAHEGKPCEVISMRRAGTTKTVGWVLPPLEVATPDKVEQALRELGHLL